MSSSPWGSEWNQPADRLSSPLHSHSHAFSCPLRLKCCTLRRIHRWQKSTARWLRDGVWEPDRWFGFPVGHFLTVQPRFSNLPNVTHSDAHVYTCTCTPRAHHAVIGSLEAGGDPAEKASLSLLHLLQCLPLFLTFPQDICQAVHLLVHFQCLSSSEGDQRGAQGVARHRALSHPIPSAHPDSEQK